jgi:hypothetical protein
MVGTRRAALWLGCGLLAAVPLAVAAQQGGFFTTVRPRGGVYANVPYDGRVAMVRIRYDFNNSWSADYPVMERNLARMLYDISELEPHLDGSNVYTLDDPELLKHPVAYLTEPGYWFPSDAEAAGLREYLEKGGFLIVDDFHYPEEWAVFEAAMRRALPGGRIDRLELSHPIFNSFFEIKSLEVPYPGRLGEMGLMGEFFGIHEDNDPRKRLVAVINYNIDLGDYVEWSADRNPFALVPTNEAYKFLINYVMYGLTR